MILIKTKLHRMDFYLAEGCFMIRYYRVTVPRAAHLAISVPTLEECSHCHEIKLPHHVCPNCGYYQGRLAIQLKPAADDAAR